MYKMTKQTFDFLLSVLLLIFLSPIMIIIAVAIKLDSSGPVLFKQQRVGKDGMNFTILKFRTMVVNAEKMGTGLDSYVNDSRVTKVGKVLRSTSLDELPQLFNILKCDMSFVGPRPPVTYQPYEFENYPPLGKRRFQVKPGVTGYAQINGRNELSWDEKFKFDSFYVDNKSFWFDLKIFILTIFKVLKMEGNYDIEKDNKRKNID